MVVESGTTPAGLYQHQRGKLPRRHRQKVATAGEDLGARAVPGCRGIKIPPPGADNGVFKTQPEKAVGRGAHYNVVRGAIADASTGDAAVSPSGGQGSSSDSDTTLQLDEVIVTASKRAEKLREVADSVTAFSGTELSQMGAQSFEDYIGRTPGVVFQKANPGLSNVTIRGVGTTTFGPDQGQGTTGIYLNDIPLTDPSYAMSIPDIDTFDLQRVEVLRGPQGTLFGAATLGGAVNYIINPVHLDTFDARLETGFSGTQHSTDVGYAAKEALNLPLITDVLGVRVTAIKRFDPGYVDNIGTGRKDSNSHDDESLSASIRYGKSIREYRSTSCPSTTSQENSRSKHHPSDTGRSEHAIRHVPEFRNFVTRINNLKVDADLDFATLTLDGARSQKTETLRADLTSYFGPDASSNLIPTTI